MLNGEPHLTSWKPRPWLTSLPRPTNFFPRVGRGKSSLVSCSKRAQRVADLCNLGQCTNCRRRSPWQKVSQACCDKLVPAQALHAGLMASTRPDTHCIHSHQATGRGTHRQHVILCGHPLGLDSLHCSQQLLSVGLAEGVGVLVLTPLPISGFPV